MLAGQAPLMRGHLPRDVETVTVIGPVTECVPDLSLPLSLEYST